MINFLISSNPQQTHKSWIYYFPFLGKRRSTTHHILFLRSPISSYSLVTSLFNISFTTLTRMLHVSRCWFVGLPGVLCNWPLVVNKDFERNLCRIWFCWLIWLDLAPGIVVWNFSNFYSIFWFFVFIFLLTFLGNKSPIKLLICVIGWICSSLFIVYIYIWLLLSFYIFL